MYKNILFILSSLFLLNNGNSQEISYSTSPSSSGSHSMSPDVSTSGSSGSPTPSCKYRTYNAASDFSGIQGTKGWYYGYYNGGVFTQFTHYQTTSYTSSLAWNYNAASYGYISSTYIMPNGATSCSTPSYGNISPVIRWINPGACYNDVTIYLSLSPGTTSVVPSLIVNGNSIYAPSNGAVYSNYFNAYDVYSIELSVGPLNGNCDNGQTTYSLIISPMGSSITARTTLNSTTSNIPSISSVITKTITNSPKLSNSILVSPSNTPSATATSTVFYLGNWTDFGQYNYAMADIVSYYDMTIYQCQLNCWLNPLCGLIVVESPCTTISLDSPAIYTTFCNVCWLKLTSGWVVSASTGSKSIMLYDRVYPPTTSSRITYTPTASAIPTSSVVTYSILNFCAVSGKTITLPFIGSSTNVMTNDVSGNYGNGLSCSVFINGAGSSQGFLVNITNFNTEGCCDPFRIYNSVGTQVYSNSGVLNPFNLYISGTSSIQLTFSSDGSTVGSGVNAIVSLVYSSISSSPSQSASLSNSPNPSFSSLTSKSITKSPNPSYSTIKSSSISSSSSQSKTSTVSIDPTDSLVGSRTNTGSASSSATVFYSGNWTDYGDVYFTGYVGVTGTITINQCMISCWINPLCGGISVNYACSNVNLDSPQIFTLQCANCRLIPKSSEMDTHPGSFNTHPEWKSFIIYDLIFPPTTSVVSSRTPTVSARPSNSIVIYSVINYCSNGGTSITLPFIDSSLMTMTNAIDTNYINNLACSVNVYGAGSSQQFRVNISSFNTEGCCDFFTVYNSNSNIIARYSGTVTSGTTFVITNSPYIRIVFTSDGSAVASGVFATVKLEYTSMSPYPSITGSVSSSKISSSSSLPSVTSYKSLSNSYSSLISISSTKSPSFSSSSLISVSQSSSGSSSRSVFESNSVSQSNSVSESVSQSNLVSNTNIITNSPIITKSSSSTYYNTHTNNKTKSQSYSQTNYNSISPTISPKPTISVSYTPTPNYALPFELPPPGKDYNSQVANQLNNYLNDLLSGGQQIPPAQALSVINTIPVLQVSDTMNILKKLSGLVTAPVSFSSSSFEGSLAPIKNNSILVNSSEYGINVPIIPNLPPNSAITAISWSNTTTFSNETTLSNIMSVSVSNKGKDTSIQNLSVPLILTWNITNIIIPPNMTLKCSYWNYTTSSWNSDGCILLQNTSVITCSCNHMTDFVARFERIADMNKEIFMNAANVYSLDGLQKYKNYYIFYGVYFLIIIITGIILQYIDIKNSKQYLLSLKENFDILSFKKDIKKFYIDKCYLYDNIIDTSQSSDSDDNMTTEESETYNDYIKYINKLSDKVYNNYKQIDSKLKCYNETEIKEIIKILLSEEISENKRNNELKEIKKLEKLETTIWIIIKLWWKRLLYQHNYFSVFFKYDPQSPRIYRIFFIFTLISHTLFMTALFYGYIHNVSDTESIIDVTSPIESITLSVITSLINVPVLNFTMSALLLAGKSEFAWRYPFIHRELHKIVIFEEEYSKIKKQTISNNSLDKINNNSNDDNVIIDILTQYVFQLCIRKKEIITESNVNESIISRMKNELLKLENIPHEYFWYYSKYIPFHTFRSMITFFGCLVYLLWTINYLLLFSADIQPSIQASILQSFGISQLFSIFLIHPITILLTLIFTLIFNKYFKKSTDKYQPLYFYSDPFVNNKSIGLTTRLSKSLFVTSIAKSSINQPTDDRIIAPAKGLIAQLTNEHVNANSIEYYDKIILFNKLQKKLNNTIIEI